MDRPLEESPGFLIDRNAYLFRSRVKETLARLDLNLTTEEALILYVLNTEDCKRIGEMAALTIRDATTVTRQTEALERKGCVKRETDPEDRRAVQVVLLDEGRRLFEKLDPAISDLKKRIFEGLSEKEIDSLVELLKKIQANSLSLGSLIKP